MKKLLIFTLFLLSSAASVNLAVTKEEGTISKNTTWSLDKSPYLLTRTVTINPGARLTIEPGVTVQFSAESKEKVKLVVEGSLIAAGTPEAKIKFTPVDVVKAKLWGGIVFNKSQESRLEYAQIEGATNGIACFASSPVISHNQIIFNEVGIVCENYSSPEISYNEIRENGMQTSSTPAGIACALYSSPKISYNTVIKNIGHGISASTFSSPRIDSNTVYHNKGTGIIILSLADPLVVNNDVAFNGTSCGITCYQSSPVIMANRVHDNNEHGITAVAGASPLIINNYLNSNGAGIAIVSASPKIFFNTIRENNQSITISYNSDPVINYNQLESSKNYILVMEKVNGTVNAKQNFWGQTDLAAIEKSISNYNQNQINIQPIEKDKIGLNEYAKIDINTLMSKRETKLDSRYPWQINGDKILFSSYRDGNWEVYMTNLNGTLTKNITNSPASDEWPSWSPDGTKVIFTSKGDSPENVEIYIAGIEENASINRLVKDTLNKEYPTWSPDGKKIAFRDEFGNLFVMESDGSARIGITSNNTIATDFPGYRSILNIWLPTD